MMQLTDALDIGAARGSLILRQATGSREIEACQRLRYRVFYEELDALADPETRAAEKDQERFDAICDHLVVIDTEGGEANDIRIDGGRLIGTYRLLRPGGAERRGGFFTGKGVGIPPPPAAPARHRSLAKP